MIVIQFVWVALYLTLWSEIATGHICQPNACSNQLRLLHMLVRCSCCCLTICWYLSRFSWFSVVYTEMIIIAFKSWSSNIKKHLNDFVVCIYNIALQHISTEPMIYILHSTIYILALILHNIQIRSLHQKYIQISTDVHYHHFRIICILLFFDLFKYLTYLRSHFLCPLVDCLVLYV